MTPILPIEYDGSFRLLASTAGQAGARHHTEYVCASPFPHICLDDFIPESIAQKVVDEFPRDKKPGDLNFEQGYSGLHKRLISPEDCSPHIYNLFQFLNSAPILKFLESLTGIRGLIPDPYYNGGGLHEVTTGGLLGVHADFRLHDSLRLQRRINLLLYLNPGWKPEWGGELGLWDRKIQVETHTIAPLFNRCVIFNTDSTSFHGHPTPLSCPEEVKRRSIAMYYYTASDAIFGEIPGNSTIYVPRRGENWRNALNAWKVRGYSVLKDVMPPVLFRGLRRSREGRKSAR